MATYDYCCIGCDVTVQITRPLTEDEPTSGCRCPKCGYAMVRQYTIGTVQFRGPGFYRTDSSGVGEWQPK